MDSHDHGNSLRAKCYKENDLKCLIGVWVKVNAGKQYVSATLHFVHHEKVEINKEAHPENYTRPLVAQGLDEPIDKKSGKFWA